MCFGAAMKVTVLLFASYADAFGAPTLDVQLPPSATVSDLLGEIAHLRGDKRLPSRPLVAVNHRYAPPDLALSPGDEIAIIPPVAGG